MAEQWSGQDYQAKFDEMQERGVDVHGEANFVLGILRDRGWSKPSGYWTLDAQDSQVHEARSAPCVLDAGCGTGRVAIELSRHGIDVVGVDPAGPMIEVAKSRASHIRWITQDMCTVVLGQSFDCVVVAGNVLLFTAPHTNGAFIENCSNHLRDGGVLITGFQLGRQYSLSELDDDSIRAGLTLLERWSSWDREPFGATSSYSVSVHVKLSED